MNDWIVFPEKGKGKEIIAAKHINISQKLTQSGDIFRKVSFLSVSFPHVRRKPKIDPND